jgi:hypothetical protein
MKGLNPLENFVAVPPDILGEPFVEDPFAIQRVLQLRQKRALFFRECFEGLIKIRFGQLKAVAVSKAFHHAATGRHL